VRAVSSTRCRFVMVSAISIVNGSLNVGQDGDCVCSIVMTASPRRESRVQRTRSFG